VGACVRTGPPEGARRDKLTAARSSNQGGSRLAALGDASPFCPAHAWNPARGSRSDVGWVDLDAGSSLIWDLNRNLEFQGIAR